MLSAELAALLECKVDLEPLGFDQAEVDQLLAELEPEAGRIDDDVVPEAPTVVVTRPGDLWQLDEHRVLCADSTVLSAVQGLLDHDGADLIIGDFPTTSVTTGAWPAALRPFSMTIWASSSAASWRKPVGS